MGKFAGFLKRVKKLAGYGVNALSSLNDIYKGIKPFIEPIVGSVPYANYINTGLNIGSNVIDKIKPITSNWLNDDDKKKLKDIDKNIKRYGGDVAQKLLNNYLDYQEDRFKDLGIFGKPLN